MEYAEQKYSGRFDEELGRSGEESKPGIDNLEDEYENLGLEVEWAKDYKKKVEMNKVLIELEK